MKDQTDKNQREQMRMIGLHFENCLALVDGLPRYLQLRALTLLLETLADKLKTFFP